MKNKISAIVILVLLLSPAVLFSQGNWSDDFNTGLGSGWYQNNHYGLSVSDGILNVNVNKSNMWASFGVNIPVQDVTSNPVVNLNVKTARPFLLSVYLFSAAGNVMVTQAVMPAADFSVVSFDFTGLDLSSNVLNAVNGIGFAVNGSALSWSGMIYFENLVVGSSAVKYANLGALPDMSFYPGSTGHKVFIRGIKNASSLELVNADALLENISFDPITPEGTSWMHFDCKPGVDATTLPALIAVADAGYTNNSSQFSLDVTANKIPSLDNIANVQASVGVAKSVGLTGITDGDGAVEQPLLINAVSSDPSVIANPVSVVYNPGSRYATLNFTPLASGNTTITVTVDDQASTNNTTSKNFDVEVLAGWNASPTLSFIPNSAVLNTAGEQTVHLSGITDGDNGLQTLTITAVSSDPSVIPDPTVIYSGGKTAELKYSPVAGVSGMATITVTVADNGGAAGNNGDQTAARTFKVETYDPPLNGYVIPFTGVEPDAYATAQPGKRDYWHVEGLGVSQQASFVKDGADDVLQLVCTKKSTWTGSWYYTPDMDLSDFPLLSMWVKCDQAIRVHIYFWDDSIRNNEDHHLEFPLVANTWTKLNFDFSDAKGMLNGKGQKVNAKRITRVLINYHPNYNWPFTDWNGTVQFKDIRIGNESGITPTYYCTIDPVGQHTYFSGSELKTINLHGISRGKDNQAQVSVRSSGKLAGLNVSAVTNGEALISFTPALAGSDTIIVNVSGADIDGKTPVGTSIKIPVYLVDQAGATASQLTTNPAQKYQVYRGLGAKDPSPNLLDLYTLDFGASAIRFGILDDNQVEPLNDNEDPNVLDMSKLNYNAFDWNYIRNLKARGVETFLLTFWSPPAWMKENLSTNNQQAAAPQWENTNNKVLTDLYDEYAEDALAVVKMFKQEADIDLTGIGLQNEPAFCEPYASAVLSPDKFADMIARVGKRFEDEGITTKLYAAEQVGGTMADGPVYSHSQYLSAFNTNPEAKKYSDVFAMHGYASDGIQPGVPPGSAGWANDFAAINADGKTRELWMTETEPAFTGWTDAFDNAANIITAFESGNVALWTEWAWDGHCVDKGKATQKLWAQSMFSFIRPGAQRISSASGNNDLLITSWLNDAGHGGKTVIVLMNKGLTPLSFSVTQSDMPLKYSVYRCSENIARFKDDSYLRGGKLILGPKSMLTLVSEVAGEPTIDPVADRIVFIGDGQVNIPLANISDGFDVNQNPVSVTYNLSDNTIISGAEITYTSPESTGLFSFSPAKEGTAIVSLIVTANEVTKVETFSIIVKDYMIPTINPVAGNLRFILEEPDRSLNLTGITDGGDGGQAITVTAEITSGTAVGNLAVNYSSPASTGQLTFDPVATGTAEITVTVTDAGPAGKNTTVTVFTLEIYSTVGIRAAGDNTVKLYPSPATDKVFIELPGNTFTKYSVFTADGMLLGRKNIEGNRIEENVSNLPNGFYLIMLEGKDKPVILNFVK